MKKIYLLHDIIDLAFNVNNGSSDVRIYIEVCSRYIRVVASKHAITLKEWTIYIHSNKFNQEISKCYWQLIDLLGEDKMSSCFVTNEFNEKKTVINRALIEDLQDKLNFIGELAGDKYHNLITVLPRWNEINRLIQKEMERLTSMVGDRYDSHISGGFIRSSTDYQSFK